MKIKSKPKCAGMVEFTEFVVRPCQNNVAVDRKWCVQCLVHGKRGKNSDTLYRPRQEGESDV